MFADDYSVVQTEILKKLEIEMLNEELSTVCTWLAVNKLTLKAEKSIATISSFVHTKRLFPFIPILQLKC